MTLEEVIQASPVRVLEGSYSVLRVSTIPSTVNYFAAVSDGSEVTIVVPADDAATLDASNAEGPFRMLRLEIAAPFAAPGFIAAATTALAQAGVNVYVLSTFSFDYVLVKAHDLKAAVTALGARRFPIA